MAEVALPIGKIERERGIFERLHVSGPMSTDGRSIVCEICGEATAAQDMLLIVEGTPSDAW